MTRLAELVDDRQFMVMASSLAAMVAASGTDGAAALFSAMVLGFVLVVRHSR